MTAKLKLVFIDEDARGRVYKLDLGKQELLLFEIKRSFLRGGHYHSEATWHNVLLGEVLYKEKNLKTGRATKKIVRAGHSVFVRKGRVHMMTGRKDSWVIERIDKRQPTNYGPWRRLVEEKMKKS